MRLTTLGRVALVVSLFAALLVANSTISLAQGPGSEVVDAVSAETNGPDAWIALESVEAFPSDGGEAVFEPGSAYEETFSYASVDEEASRLVGLVRPSPIAHSIGVFVAAPTTSTEPPAETSDPTEPPAEVSDPTEPPAEASAGNSEPTSHGIQAEQSNTIDSLTPDPCYMVTEKSCAEVLTDVCHQTSSVCDELVEIIEDIDTGDPCDPDNTGQTCLQHVANTLAGLISDPPIPEQECQGDDGDPPTCELPGGECEQNIDCYLELLDCAPPAQYANTPTVSTLTITGYGGVDPDECRIGTNGKPVTVCLENFGVRVPGSCLAHPQEGPSMTIPCTLGEWQTVVMVPNFIGWPPEHSGTLVIDDPFDCWTPPPVV